MLARPDTDPGPHAVPTTTNAMLTWDYERTNGPLVRLCERAKQLQWDAADLPWEIDVDQERDAVTSVLTNGFATSFDRAGTPFEHWGKSDWTLLGIEAQNWMLSQFLHGEQGALLCTAKLAFAVPSIDAKHYAATQAVDEARHVEVFARYLDEKLSGHYPINTHLGALLDDIISDARWDVTFLGMQVLVEGLALAAFGAIRVLAHEPLLEELLRRVMADEARHVAFGVVSLAQHYDELTSAELRDRQEFTYQAIVRMQDRFLMQEVWERFGIDAEDGARLMRSTPEYAMFQHMLFSRIVPNCRKLGLLDASDGWLRQRFTEVGIVAFEHCTDAEQEAQLDELLLS
ncbi:MAG: hypothetical protein QOG30_2476 [Acidimicrobiaceae bacterium]|jgi:hypothetical protein